MAFHFRPTLGQTAELALVPLQNAISHWGDIWAARPAAGQRSSFGTPSAEPVSLERWNEMWKRVGFMRHAHEFWMVSRIIVDRTATATQGRRDGLLENEKGPQVDVGRIGRAGIGSPKPLTHACVLDKYDQSSMDHLRIMILTAVRSS
jgi:hypothetical protein